MVDSKSIKTHRAPKAPPIYQRLGARLCSSNLPTTEGLVIEDQISVPTGSPY